MWNTVAPEMKVIHFCGKQGIALRGHNEESESGNSKPGNFIALLEMFALEDPTQRDHLKKKPCCRMLHTLSIIAKTK